MGGSKNSIQKKGGPGYDLPNFAQIDYQNFPTRGVLGVESTIQHVKPLNLAILTLLQSNAGYKSSFCYLVPKVV